MASKIITILRTDNLSPITSKKDGNIEEWNSIAIRAKCARLHNQTKMYTGLGFIGKDKPYDFDLERQVKKLLFQDILSMDFNENTVNTFYSEVNKYYESLSFFVPYNGKDFEIGLEGNNNNKVSATNMPINVSDYIIYKALFENDAETAEDEAQGKSTSLYWFYKKDKTKEKEQQLKKQESISTANTYYDKIRDKNAVHRVMLSELGIIVQKDNTDNLLKLHEFVNQDPAKFIELYNLYEQNPEHFMARLRLRRYCEQNLIVKASHGGYIDVKSEKELANSLEEMLIFMTKPENREIMNNYKIMYEEKTM